MAGTQNPPTPPAPPADDDAAKRRNEAKNLLKEVVNEVLDERETSRTNNDQKPKGFWDSLFG